MVWAKHSSSSIKVRCTLKRSLIVTGNYLSVGRSALFTLRIEFLCMNRKLAVYDDWSSLVIHVAMDNTVIENDISKL